MEETTNIIFKIVSYMDNSNEKRYKWYNFTKGNWECSEKSFQEKGECLYNFLVERVSFINDQ